MRTISLVARRELADVFGARGRLGRLALLGGALPLIFLLVLRSQAAGAGYDLSRLTAAVIGVYVQLGIMPLSAAMAAAATSFATEFEAGTAIPLLASPVRTWEIFWGKCIAALVTGVGLAWFAQGAFWSFFTPATGRPWPLAPDVTLLISAAVPVFMLPFVAGAMALGSRAKRARTAQTNSSLAFIAILSAVLLVGLRRPPVSLPLLVWGSFGWALGGVLLLTAGVRMWNREEILSRPD